MSWKFKTFALGIVSVVLMLLAQASAAPVVRDHREKPVVRDHRGNGAPGGGVVVTNNGTRKHNKKLRCIGIPCI